MKVLVTGSSGFIGQHVVHALSGQGCTVLAIDVRAPKTRPVEHDFQLCDILDSDGLGHIVQTFEPHSIVHLAARTDLNEKLNLAGYAPNIEGVSNLLGAIRRTPSVRRCIVTSSQLVCRVGYLPVNDHDYCPNTLYGESKVMTERIVRQLDGGGCDWCIVRPTTIWGPGMSPHYQRFFDLIRRGKYFHVGKRMLYKSFGFVGNTAFQYAKLLEVPTEQIQRKTLYLADYQPISLRKWADAFQRGLGGRPIKTCPDFLAKTLARVGDVITRAGYASFPFNSFRLNNILTEYQFDLSETEKICGPLPYSMDDGVRETIKWMVAPCSAPVIV